MVRNSTPLYLFFFFALFFSGCGSVSKSRSLFGKEKNRNKKIQQREQTVSRRQYDQLQAKYKALVGEGGPSGKRDSHKTREMMNQIEKDVAKTMAGIDFIKKGKRELAETVDVFGKAGVIKSSSSSQDNQKLSSGEVIEQHIELLRRVEKQIEQSRFDEALVHIKKMEGSPIRQIAVRAKYLWGESLFRQGEYDLSMQIYEEIIQKYAFSGMVLKALRRLIVCSEKLNLETKRKKYYSILHDFFEEKA